MYYEELPFKTGVSPDSPVFDEFLDLNTRRLFSNLIFLTIQIYGIFLTYASFLAIIFKKIFYWISITYTYSSIVQI